MQNHRVKTLKEVLQLNHINLKQSSKLHQEISEKQATKSKKRHHFEELGISCLSPTLSRATDQQKNKKLDNQPSKKRKTNSEQMNPIPPS